MSRIKDMDKTDLFQLSFLPPQGKRKLRQGLKKASFEDNNVSKRLVWVRESLELRAVDVYSKLGIPSATFCDREAGARTYHYEEIQVLSKFYNKKWQDKFLSSGNYPKFEGKEIIQVTIPWLMFGEDEVFDQMNQAIEILTKNFEEKEKDMTKRLIELGAKK